MKYLALALAALVASSAAFAGGQTATLDVTNMVDFKTKRALVTFDPAKTTTQALTKATADAGFPSTVKRDQ